MKMLIIVILVRKLFAYLETARSKEKKNVRDAENEMVQHPAATLLR